MMARPNYTQNGSCQAPNCMCTHRKKTKYCQPPVVKSFAIKAVYHRPCTVMDSSTVYKLSYKPSATVSPRSAMFIQPGNLTIACGKMSGDTVQKLSYLPTRMNKLHPTYPCDHDLSGKGPMQDLTTQKHDYVPKPFMTTKAILPVGNLHCSDLPIEDKTVNRLSYPSPGAQQVPRSYAPVSVYSKSGARMDCATVNRLSYRPNAVNKRWMPPKASYCPPRMPMDTNTIYGASYLPPGEECDDEEENGPCSCYHDGEAALHHDYPRAAAS